MRVLFIQSLSMEGPSPERVYPIGIAVLAGSLRERGYLVEMVDMNIEPDPFAAVKNSLVAQEHRPARKQDELPCSAVPRDREACFCGHAKGEDYRRRNGIFALS